MVKLGACDVSVPCPIAYIRFSWPLSLRWVRSHYSWTQGRCDNYVPTVWLSQVLILWTSTIRDVKWRKLRNGYPGIEPRAWGFVGSGANRYTTKSLVLIDEYFLIFRSNISLFTVFFPTSQHQRSYCSLLVPWSGRSLVSPLSKSSITSACVDVVLWLDDREVTPANQKPSSLSGRYEWLSGAILIVPPTMFFLLLLLLFRCVLLCLVSLFVCLFVIFFVSLLLWLCICLFL